METKRVQRSGVRGQLDGAKGIKIVPVIITALGTIKKEFDQNLQLLPGYLSATELQVTLMSNAHDL